MKIPCTDIPFDVSSHRLLRIEDPEHVLLRARRGTLWITIDGEARDIVVEPGETFEFASRAPATVGTLQGVAQATARRRCGEASAHRRGAWPDWLQRRASAA